MSKLPIVAKALKLNYSSWKDVKNHKPHTKYFLVDPKTDKRETVTIIGGLGDERIIAPIGYGKKSKIQSELNKMQAIYTALGIGALTSIFSKVTASPGEQYEFPVWSEESMERVQTGENVTVQREGADIDPVRNSFGSKIVKAFYVDSYREKFHFVANAKDISKDSLEFPQDAQPLDEGSYLVVKLD